MSKVISFSISDRYLDKLRTLYPNSTDNLAVKQFVTDRLDGSLDDALDDNLKTIIESSLSSTLDDTLDDVLDDKLKTIIETSLDGILDERLNATAGKLITSLSERLARLEARLDTNLDGGLDGSLDVKLDYGLPYQPSKDELTETQRRVLESRQLAKAKLEHAAYLVKNPLVVRDLSKKQPIAVSIETVETADSVETVDTVEIADKVESVDESGTSPLPNQENVETAIETVEAIDEPDKGAIGPVPGEGDSIDTVKGKGMTAKAAVDYLKAKKVKVSYASLHRWRDGVSIPNTSPQGRDARKHLILRDKLYYPIN